MTADRSRQIISHRSVAVHHAALNAASSAPSGHRKTRVAARCPTADSPSRDCRVSPPLPGGEFRSRQRAQADHGQVSRRLVKAFNLRRCAAAYRDARIDLVVSCPRNCEVVETQLQRGQVVRDNNIRG